MSDGIDIVITDKINSNIRKKIRDIGEAADIAHAKIEKLKKVLNFGNLNLGLKELGSSKTSSALLKLQQQYSKTAEAAAKSFQAQEVALNSVIGAEEKLAAVTVESEQRRQQAIIRTSSLEAARTNKILISQQQLGQAIARTQVAQQKAADATVRSATAQDLALNKILISEQRVEQASQATARSVIATQSAKDRAYASNEKALNAIIVAEQKAKAATDRTASAALLNQQKVLQASNRTASQIALNAEKIKQASNKTESLRISNEQKVQQIMDKAAADALLNEEKITQASDRTTNSKLLNAQKVQQAMDKTAADALASEQRLEQLSDRTANAKVLNAEKVKQATDKTTNSELVNQERLKRELARTTDLEDRLAATAAKAKASVKSVDDVKLNRIKDQVKQVDSSIVGMGASFRNVSRMIRTAAAGLYLGREAKYLVESLDAPRRLQNSLSVVSRVDNPNGTQNDQKTLARQNALYAELMKTANEARVPVKALSQDFIKYDNTLKELGFGQSKTIDIMSTLSKALVLLGSDANEVNAVMSQLGDTFGARKLNSDEFKSMKDKLPTLIKAITEVTGKSFGEVQKMSEDQKLTIDIVIKAIDKMQKTVNEQFGKTARTAGQAFVQLGNAALDFFRTLDAKYGIISKIVAVIDYLRDHLPEIATLLKALAAGLVASLGTSVLGKVAGISNVIKEGLVTAVSAVLTLGTSLPFTLPRLIDALATSFTGLSYIVPALVGYFAYFADEIKVSEDGLVTLNDLFMGFVRVAQEFISAVGSGDFFGKYFSSDTAQAVFNKVSEVLSYILDIVIKIGAGLATAFQVLPSLFDKVDSANPDSSLKITAIAGELYNALGSAVLNGLIWGFQQFLTLLGPLLMTIANEFIGTLNSALPSFMQMNKFSDNEVQNKGGDFAKTLDSLKVDLGAITPEFQKFKAEATDAFTINVDAATSAVDTIKRSVMGAARDIHNEQLQSVQQLGQGLNPEALRLYDPIQAAKAALEGFDNTAKSATGSVGNLMNTVGQFGSIASNSFDVATGSGEAFISEMNSGLSSIGSAIGQYQQEAQDAFGNLLEGVDENDSTKDKIKKIGMNLAKGLIKSIVAHNNEASAINMLGAASGQRGNASGGDAMGQAAEMARLTTPAINGVQTALETASIAAQLYTDKLSSGSQAAIAAQQQVQQSLQATTQAMQQQNQLQSQSPQNLASPEQAAALQQSAFSYQQIGQTIAGAGPAMTGFQMAMQGADSSLMQINSTAPTAGSSIQVIGQAFGTAGSAADTFSGSASSSFSSVGGEANSLGSTIGSSISSGADAASSAISSMASSAIADFQAMTQAALEAADAASQAGGSGGGFGGGGGIFASGGYTGNMGRGQVAGLVHGQEFVIPAGPTKKYRPLLEAMRAGRSLPTMPGPASKSSGGSSINVKVENYGSSNISVQQLSATDIRIIARDEAATVVRQEAPNAVASAIRNPNSKVSKSLIQSTNSKRRR